MGKKQKPAKPAAEAPARKSAPVALTVIAAVAAFVVAAGSTYLLAAEPSPLGVPIPTPPKPIFKILKSKGAKGLAASVIHHVVPMGYVMRLAPQPDGLPYLHEHIHSEKLGYDISYPYGVENVQFGYDSFAKDYVDTQANIRLDQPLAAVKVSLPENNGKLQLDFVKDFLASALKEGAKPVEQPHEVKLPGGGFATVAYRRTEEGNNYVHRLYCAAVRKRILIFDFYIRPETASEGDRYATKIMNSFEPGSAIEEVMEQPPAKPGSDVAGSNSEAAKP